MGSKKSKQPDNTIARNKKASFDYHFEDRFEAGIMLQGWEVKAIRMGKAQIVDSYVFFKNGEAFLLNAQIQPLNTVSTHFVTEPNRSRKLLLHEKELAKLIVATQQKGYSCVCTRLYWKNHLVKVEIALGKGKQAHDKRAAEKDRDWSREKQRVMQKNT